ncbi:uncharacterized protein LOC128987329 [Macrosteles quadrilineatus]|uniref:uncharacterized protein LOC128987329 n=1 Tax=Macrosteles quadrilineatus TaxID=74068 RepID=UPI0023E13EDA|nr:uncharacterized protein LOC128987329 [Macrosteles quadrilineatus]
MDPDISNTDFPDYTDMDPDVSNTDFPDYTDMDHDISNTDFPDMDETLPECIKPRTEFYLKVLIIIMAVIFVMNLVVYTKCFRDLMTSLYNFFNNRIIALFASVARPSGDIRSPAIQDFSWTYKNNSVDNNNNNNKGRIATVNNNNSQPLSFCCFVSGAHPESSAAPKKKIKPRKNLQTPKTSVKNIKATNDLDEVIVDTSKKDEKVNAEKINNSKHDLGSRNNALDEKIIIVKKKLVTVPEDSVVDLHNVDEKPAFIYAINPSNKYQKPTKDQREGGQEIFI